MWRTKDQREAVRELEEAFLKCRKSGVGVFAMDDTVYVVDGRKHDYKRDFHQQYQSGEKPFESVATHKAFIGCGGW